MTITISRRWLKWIGLFGAIFAFVALQADSCDSSSSNNKEQTVESNQQSIYNRNQPIPIFQYSAVRQELIDIEDMQAKQVDTWTVFYSNTGTPLDMCPSKGYPIPYSTELSNPQQIDYNGGSGGGGNVAVSQMDPTGVYPSQNSLGDWVVCLESDGSEHPVFVEPMAIGYPWPVEIQNGKVVKTGSANPDTKLKTK